MTDFLTRLIQRQTGMVPTIEPRRPSMFASDGFGKSGSGLGAIDGEVGPVFLQAAVSAEHQPASHLGEPIEGKPFDRGDANVSMIPLVTNRLEPRQPILQRGERSLAPSDEMTAREPSSEPHFEDQIRPTPPMSLKPIAPVAAPMTNDASRQPEAVGSRSQLEPPRSVLPVRLVRHDFGIEGAPLSAPAPLATTGSKRRPEQGAPEPAESPVHVTIGRIEVSAVTAPSAPARKPSGRQPSMTLEQYLSGRRGTGV